MPQLYLLKWLTAMGAGCHQAAYLFNKNALLNTRKIIKAKSLQLFLDAGLFEKYPARRRITIQLNGDNKNDRIPDATWCNLKVNLDVSKIMKKSGKIY